MQEPPLTVAEVLQVQSPTKCLVKVPIDDKQVVPITSKIDIDKLRPGTRVAMKDNGEIVMILP